MITLGNWGVLFFTNPGESMLLGFDFQKSELFDEMGEHSGSSDIFSIGFFFGRIDVFFNTVENE